MPSVTSETIAMVNYFTVSADSFYLRFVDGAAQYDRWVWNDTGFDLIAYTNLDNFLRLMSADLLTARTVNTVDYSIDVGGTVLTVDVTWTDGATCSYTLTPHEDWIELEVTEFTRNTATDVLQFQLTSQSYTVPQTKASSGSIGNLPFSSHLQYTNSGSLAWGMVPGSYRWAPIRNGPMRMILGYTGTMPTDADAVGEKFGIYLTTVRNCGMRIRQVLEEMDATSDLLYARTYRGRTKNTFFVSDYATDNGGSATPGATLGNTIVTTANLIGADVVVLQEQLWRDYDNKFEPLSGVATMISTIQAAGLSVALHVQPYMWATAASGAGSYNDAAYTGQTVDMTGTYNGFTRFGHWGDSIATPTDIENEIPADLKSGYDNSGADAGLYLDSLECIDEESGGASLTFYYIPKILLELLGLMNVPIWGMSGNCGLSYLLRTRLGTLDITEDVEAFVDAINYNSASYVRKFGLIPDYGWIRAKPSTYITTDQLLYAVKHSVASAGGWTIQSPIAEIDEATAAADGLIVRAAKFGQDQKSGRGLSRRRSRTAARRRRRRRRIRKG